MGGFLAEILWLLTALKMMMMKNQKKMNEAQSILSHMFPQDVADSLANGEKLEPKKVPNAAILFLDIVGYTDLSTKVEPEKITEMLDRFYNKLDKLSIHHGLTKIGTVGSAIRPMFDTRCFRNSPC